MNQSKMSISNPKNNRSRWIQKLSTVAKRMNMIAERLLIVGGPLLLIVGGLAALLTGDSQNKFIGLASLGLGALLAVLLWWPGGNR